MKIDSYCTEKGMDMEKFKENFQKVWEKTRTFFSFSAVQLIALSFILEVIIEMLSRRSVKSGFLFVLKNPVIALYSMVIIMLTLSIAYFFKKRVFALSLISVFWIILATINCVVLSFRTTPLAMTDFELITSVWTIASAYLTVANVITIAVAVVALIGLFVLLWKYTGKVAVKYIQAGVTLALMAVLTFGGTPLLINAGILTDRFPNLPTAYKNYGFVYCFSSGAVSRGISKPDGYSSEIMDAIAAGNIGDGVLDASDELPNIIFIQLESFFDVNYLNNMTFSENPVPNFTKLKEEYPSAFFSVPAIGAGTANTEFEVLTQMSLDYFGTGEYPYKTILKQRTCESICYDLKELGYSAHAIHNHSGAFYDRNDVFSKLGFDTFTSLEYMQNITYTPRGWCRDYVLTDEILKALHSTDGQDLIYTISVQPHGRYPTSLSKYPDLEISVEGIEGKGKTAQFTYYVNQLHETDEFIGILLDRLEELEEDTVVVMYGDHLPSLEIEETDLNEGNLFQTEYVIWSNFDLDAQAVDLYSYQLSAHVFSQLGISCGTMTKYHQQNMDADEDEYQKNLELLEYDILYGDMEVYNGVNPYEATDLKMGISEINVTGAEYIGDSFCVTGDNFTEFSSVRINGRLYDTMYVNRYTLLVTDVRKMDSCSIEVVQIGKNKEELSSTDTYEFTAPPESDGDSSSLEDDMIDDLIDDAG